jgi:hypothetical protein
MDPTRLVQWNALTELDQSLAEAVIRTQGIFQFPLIIYFYVNLNLI